MNPDNPTARDTHFLQAFAEAGHRPEHVTAAASAGLTWPQILALGLGFGALYGPQLFNVIIAVTEAVKSPGGLTPQSIATLVTRYGPSVYAMLVVVSGWFGVTMPQLPVV